MSTSSFSDSPDPLTPPADIPFVPRKEFVPDIIIPHDFAVLSFSEANVVKLIGFPDEVLSSLKRELKGDEGMGEGIKWERTRDEKGDIIEDAAEWWLIGKPLKDKSQTAELLLVLIFSHLLSHSFHFLSFMGSTSGSPNHRLTVIFKRPLEPSSGSPRSAFALVFPSPSIIRVVDAPLAETPGILAVIRHGWARSLKAERRLGGGCYEFKLKSSGFFSSSTPEPSRFQVAIDSLHALNRQGIDLITTVRLNGSEIWIFECPAGPTDSA